MKYLFPVLLFGLIALPVLGEPAKTTKKTEPVSLKDMVFKWTKSSNADGLNLYWSKVDGSQVIAFRGEGIVDAPIEKVASIIIDTTRGTEWIDSLVKSDVVRNISTTEFIEYDHVGIAFPFDTLMSDRDFVSRVNLEADPKSKRIAVDYTPAVDDLAPTLKKYVRGWMTCEFKLVPMSLEGETYVEAEIHCDPKGSVAPWVVNFFQQGWPQTTFERLRKQAKKTDIQILPVVQHLLEKPAIKLVKSTKNP